MILISTLTFTGNPGTGMVRRPILRQIQPQKPRPV
jgi:hypothetical protein